MLRLIGILADLGIHKVRITGGEPFVRKDLTTFMRRITEIPGIEKLSITTNGTAPLSTVDELKEMGIHSVNLSLDTLDAERFLKITRRDELTKVMEYYQKLLENNISTKINMVVMEKQNIDDLEPMAGLTLKDKVDVRFIEEMPFNGGSKGFVPIEWNHQKILSHLTHSFGPLEKLEDEQSVSIDEAAGQILAEDLVADRDMPPFDRVTMDGIAIVYKTFNDGKEVFPIEHTVAAGTPQYKLKDSAHCVEIMTGAIMPIGVDTVIPYEMVQIGNGMATIKAEIVKEKQNVHFKGLDRKAGDVLVRRNQKITATELMIAATIGKSRLKVYQNPKAVVISTGDELVEIEENPQAHQIRKSNVFGIRSMLESMGLEAHLLHLPDNEEVIRIELKKALNDYDCLVLAGGVSKGKFDFIPSALEELNVRKFFHKVRQRPGKPFWFGKSDAGKLVFALPGNPVSAFMCATVYLARWIRENLGQSQSEMKVKLAEDVKFPPDLTYFLQVKTHQNENAEWLATPVLHHGSGDFSNLTDSDGFIVLPTGKDLFKKGEIYPFIPFI
ncbi:moeA [Symbiodinium microadriaticum]|nr:moeA [Symbiodinium microadriaticum]